MYCIMMYVFLYGEPPARPVNYHWIVLSPDYDDIWRPCPAGAAAPKPRLAIPN